MQQIILPFIEGVSIVQILIFTKTRALLLGHNTNIGHDYWCFFNPANGDTENEQTP